jgi:ribonucleoside-triphosphate reductase
MTAPGIASPPTASPAASLANARSNSGTPSFRAQLVTRRTYNRPLNPEGTEFETWEQTVDRVIRHQTWLWVRARGETLTDAQYAELNELRQHMYDRKLCVSGRTLWLGGTDIAQRREATQFNCSFARVETVHDVVDAFWLLLQGCGVGFEPVPGTLNGFACAPEIEVIRSTRGPTEKGREDNQAIDVQMSEEGCDGGETRAHIIQVGDSASAWAKAVGKIMAFKGNVDRLVLDFSEIRGGGGRLSEYGWISSGDETLHKALLAICEILKRRQGELLTRMDILDVMNWLGTALSSRRSAEIATMPFTDPEAEAFAYAKKDHFPDNPQRAQSNNSLVFWHAPSKLELKGIFQMMLEAGGSEPGFLNGVEAKRRAPWFKGVNPCAEILLGNKSFCNLVEVDVGKFADANEEADAGLTRALQLAARANYRQTCVNLKDEVLQETWHELNSFLRLCGVGLTGIVKYLDERGQGSNLSESGQLLELMRFQAQTAANDMAMELGLPFPQAVTTVKPSGTLSKIMDTTEGVHRPLGKYIFNNINFSTHDPIVGLLRAANYRIIKNPYDASGVIITIPHAYEDVRFSKVALDDGRIVEVNQESALDQLKRYQLLMTHYVDHNCSVTVSYSPEEVPEIVDWLHANWGDFVGVSWLLRNDPTKTAADLGYPYLPQEVVSEEAFADYVKTLLPVDIDQAGSLDELEDEECAGGVCPVR